MREETQALNSAFERMGSQRGGFMLARIHQLRARRVSFAFETTLAARSYVRFLREAQESGYLVHVIYIWLGTVQLALSRVAVRVRQGGHGVPADAVERRYWRGLRNLFNFYRPLANTWTLCDNSGEELITVARGSKNAEPTVFEPDRYDRIQKMAFHGP